MVSKDNKETKPEEFRKEIKVGKHTYILTNATLSHRQNIRDNGLSDEICRVYRLEKYSCQYNTPIALIIAVDTICEEKSFTIVKSQDTKFGSNWCNDAAIERAKIVINELYNN